MVCYSYFFTPDLSTCGFSLAQNDSPNLNRHCCGLPGMEHYCHGDQLQACFTNAYTSGSPSHRPLHVVWIIVEPTLWRFLDRLPINWGVFGRYSRRGWHFYDKAESHLRYGPIWALVTPCDIYVYVADPNAIHDVFIRREDFLRPSKMYSK